MTKDEKQIQELYRDYWRYMIEKNADGLREITAKDYYLLHMTGTKQTADAFLEGLINGTFNYYSAEHEDISINITGDTATMVGKSKVSAAVYGGGKHFWRLKGDFTIKKENGRWKFTSSEASTY